MSAVEQLGYLKPIVFGAYYPSTGAIYSYMPIMETSPSFDQVAYETMLEPLSPSSQSNLTLFLPTVIRNRLPALPLIRSRNARPSKDLNAERSSSRPPSISSVEGALIPCMPAESTNKSARTSRSSSNTSSGTTTPRSPDRSGINWRIAGAGVRLWLSGRQQLEDDPNADLHMMRTMHIDALKYMHAALPEDLTPVEVDTIVGSLPRRVRDNMTYDPQANSVHSSTIPENNVLRRITANLVYLFMALLVFLLPFLIASLNKLLRYEREHRISEKILSHGAATANALVERGLNVKDSRAGYAMLGAIVWTVDGIIGGVNDGLIRSTSTLRVRQSSMQYVVEQ